MVPDITEEVQTIWAWGSNLKESLCIPSPCAFFEERREEMDSQYFHLLLPPHSNTHEEEIVDVRKEKGNWASKSCFSSPLDKLLCNAASIVPCSHSHTQERGTLRGTALCNPHQHRHRLCCSWPASSKTMPVFIAAEEFSVIVCKKTTVFCMLARTVRRHFWFAFSKMPLKIKKEGSRSWLDFQTSPIIKGKSSWKDTVMFSLRLFPLRHKENGFKIEQVCET